MNERSDREEALAALKIEVIDYFSSGTVSSIRSSAGLDLNKSRNLPL